MSILVCVQKTSRLNCRRPKAELCLSIVKNAHGEICRTPEESQNRWIEYFQAMEGGQRMNQVQYRSH